MKKSIMLVMFIFLSSLLFANEYRVNKNQKYSSIEKSYTEANVSKNFIANNGFYRGFRRGYRGKFYRGYRGRPYRKFRRGFRGGFHRGFRRGFRGGFYRGHRRGFRRGFRS